MSSFTAARVRVVPGVASGDRFDSDAFDFYVGRPDSGTVIHVPAQTRVGPSIPVPLLRRAPRRLRRWVICCLLKASLLHDHMRRDLEFCLIDCDALFLVALEADRPSWRGPRWAGDVLRELAFLAVRTNRSRD